MYNMYLYTVNKVNLNFNLLCGQEVWSEPWTGGGGKNGASKWTNYKNLVYVVLVGKPFHLIANIYIRVQFFSRKGGVLLLGSALLLGGGGGVSGSKF